MIAYLLKVTLCALLFLVAYSLFLEKERMHRFKRFYLLFSLVLSFTIPLVVLEIPSKFFEQTAGHVYVLADEASEEKLMPVSVLEQEEEYAPISSLVEESFSVTFVEVLAGLYLAVVVFLFLRFLRNIMHLILSAKRDNVILDRGAKVVLVEQKMVPHSFMNYIFINKDEYINQQIEDEILKHELVHVKQKHSYDILFIELLLILFWFNPIFYFYRSRMKLNHEFLADEGVVQGLEDVAHYQLILLDKVNEKRKLSLASNFNYLITKKRLIMMTKITSKKMLWLKIGGLLPLFIVAVLLFSTYVVAEQKNELSPVSPGIEQDVKTQKKGLTEEEMAEFKILYEKARKNIQGKRLTKEEEAKFISLSEKLSDIQLKEYPPLYKSSVMFVPPKKNESQKRLSKGEMAEFDKLVEKYKTDESGKVVDGDKMTQKEKERFDVLVRNMSEEQLEKAPLVSAVKFVPPKVNKSQKGLSKDGTIIPESGISEEEMKGYKQIVDQ